MQRYENNLKTQSFIYFFTDFLKKSYKKFWRFKKKQYLCTRNSARALNQMKSLGYGVMVTLQILVLPFLVRVRVPQQRKSLSS